AGQVRRSAVGAGLDTDVAQGGGLHRAGDYGQAAGVGGELAQRFVAGAAADEVDHVDRAAGEPGRVPDGGAVGDGEAVEDAADVPGTAGRRPLAGMHAVGVDAG